MDKIFGIIPIRKSDRHEEDLEEDLKDDLENDLEDVDFMDLPQRKLWLVSWKSRRGEYSSETERTSIAFFNANDAKKYIEKIEYAKKILRYKEDIEIRLEEQEC